MGREMKKRLALFLCEALILVGALETLAASKKTEEIAVDSHLFEYFEYEAAVLSTFSDQYDSAIPNWRELYLRKVKKYEEFLKKYPNSPLSAEVKLRIAELYKNVEKEEVYSFRVKLYRCISEYSDENGGTLEERERCIKKFYENIGKWRDPAYGQKAVNLLLELIRDYGHVKRYSMEEPRLGGFKWIDEEIGAISFYLLSKGTDLKNKEKILLLILREYKTGPKLLYEITEDLKKIRENKTSKID